MGALSLSETVTINAPLDQVLAAVRDLPSQTMWFPGLLSSEVLSSDDQGRPTRARQVNDVKIAKDEYELDYAHTDSGMSWKLASPSKAQKDASGGWQLVDKGGSTEATLSLMIEPSLPLPGFMVKKALSDTLKGATKGLKAYVES